MPSHPFEPARGRTGGEDTSFFYAVGARGARFAAARFAQEIQVGTDDGRGVLPPGPVASHTPPWSPSAALLRDARSPEPQEIQMKKSALLLAAVVAACAPQDAAAPDSEVAAWEEQAERITIIRDDWGIPHVYGPTDADAVFGMVYAQAEDDYPRIERNYLFSLGRLSEAEGEAEIFTDLRMKLFVDPDDLRARYDESPEWLDACWARYRWVMSISEERLS